MSCGSGCNANAGKLRHRITIEKPTRATDGTTGITWADFRRNKAARVAWGTGREQIRSGTNVEAIDDGTILMRYDKSITPDMRATFLHGDVTHTLNFTSVRPDAFARWLTVTFKEDR